MIMIDFQRMTEVNMDNLLLLYDAGLLWKYFEYLSKSTFAEDAVEKRIYSSVDLNYFVDVFSWSDTSEGFDFWGWIEDHV